MTLFVVYIPNYIRRNIFITVKIFMKDQKGAYMIKIVATQVEPEYQVSPLFEDDFRMQEVVLIGAYNRKSGSAELIDFIGKFEDYADDLNDILCKEKDPDKAVKEMTDYFDLSSAYGPDYTPSSDLEDWKKAISEIEYTQYEEHILTCLTGRKYARITIRGCSQSEWATLIYPADWTEDELSNFEIEYFDLGTEWSLDSEDYDLGATFYYTHTFADEKAKEEMADFFGVDKEEIQLKVLEGYKKIPEYRVL